MREEDIRRRQEDDIAKISTVLSIPRVAACMLLRQYKWPVPYILHLLYVILLLVANTTCSKLEAEVLCDLFLL